MSIMTRALICDPELPAKAAQGRLDEIRACIGCNQACIGHFHAGYPISCIQFPETGRELDSRGRASRGCPPRARGGRAGRARDRRRAGGPQGGGGRGGARPRRHARRGGALGGRPGAAGPAAARRDEMGGAITNLEAEARRAGVRIVTGVRADTAYVRASGAEVVLVATGAVPYRPPLELMGAPVSSTRGT